MFSHQSNKTISNTRTGSQSPVITWVTLRPDLDSRQVALAAGSSSWQAALRLVAGAGVLPGCLASLLGCLASLLGCLAHPAAALLGSLRLLVEGAELLGSLPRALLCCRRAVVRSTQRQASGARGSSGSLVRRHVSG